MNNHRSGTTVEDPESPLVIRMEGGKRNIGKQGLKKEKRGKKEKKRSTQVAKRDVRVLHADPEFLLRPMPQKNPPSRADVIVLSPGQRPQGFLNSMDELPSTAHFDKVDQLFDPSRLTFYTLPLLPKKEVRVDEMIIKRSFRHRLFLALTDTEESKFGFAFVWFILILIALSCATFIMESYNKSLVYEEGFCRENCKPLSGMDTLNDTMVTARRALGDACKDCRPQPQPFFAMIEIGFITTFTAEFIIKLLTVTAVQTAEEYIKGGPSYTFPNNCAWKRFVIFFKDPLTVIDAVAIFPFYINLAVNGSTRLQVLRVIRLFRVFRILRLGKYGESVWLYYRVLRKSIHSFAIFFVFSTFGMVVFASLMFFAESGEWDAASGEFLRDPEYYLNPGEPSPFTSIPRAFWWVLVTFSTVGYGDLYPTTQQGMLVGTITMYLGIILVAMPITIMAVHLTDEIAEQRKSQLREERVLANAKKFIHIIVTKRQMLPIRRAWNTWFEFAKTQVSEETDVASVVRKEFQRHRDSLTESVAPLMSTSTISEDVDTTQRKRSSRKVKKKGSGSADDIETNRSWNSVLVDTERTSLDPLRVEVKQLRSDLGELRGEVRAQIKELKKLLLEDMNS